LTGIISVFELLSDLVDEYKAVLKFLRVGPRKYMLMVMQPEDAVSAFDTACPSSPAVRSSSMKSAPLIMFNLLHPQLVSLYIHLLSVDNI
jgi:hypothetical protein